MAGTCILVADGSRARYFAVTPHTLRFRELTVLVEPELRLPSRDIYSSVKSGRKQSPGGGPAHGMDEHRSRHRDEVEAKFAKRIAEQAVEMLRREGADELVVVAEPRLLGLLRPPLHAMLPKGKRFEEVAEDLSWHSTARIRRALERQGLLPRRPAAPPWKPAGQL